jgi:signal transduction histidine kinase
MKNITTQPIPDVQAEINHDMRNLLINISSLSALLVQGLLHEKNNSEVRQLAKMICTLSQESLHLILNNSHMQQRKKNYGLVKCINVTNLLHERCLWLYQKSAWTKSIRFTFSIKNTALYLNMNESDFYRIFDNLVSNAIKFTPANGTITLNCKRQKNLFCATLEDSGIGIPEDIKPGIFLDHRTTRRKGTNNELSTGIGLMVVKKLVDEHGGKAWFESETNKGSRFHISFPLAHQTG